MFKLFAYQGGGGPAALDDHEPPRLRILRYGSTSASLQTLALEAYEFAIAADSPGSRGCMALFLSRRDRRHALKVSALPHRVKR